MQVAAAARSGKNNVKTSTTVNSSQEEISMDEIWKEITLLEEDGDVIKPVYDPYNDLSPPIWEYSPDTLWMMMSNDQEESTSKLFNYPTSGHFGAPLTR